MSNRLGKLLAPLAYWSGRSASRWTSSARGGGFTAVLCYHRIVDSAERRKAGLTVDEGTTAGTFEAQLRFMLRHFEPVQASAVFEPAGAKPRFAVTFDDGYADNLEVAAPVLRRLGVPAAFYVVSSYVGSERRFWWDRLAALVRGTELPVLAAREVDGVDATLPERLPLHDADARRQAVDLLGASLRNGDPAQVEPRLARLAQALGSEDRALPADRLMDWDDLRRLVAQGFEIGAHSADHLNLAALDGTALDEQVHGARRRIEAETGAPVLSFAYPYGGPLNVSPAVLQAVRRAGYRGAFTAQAGIASDRDDPVAVPRVVLNWPWRFACAYNLDRALRGQG